MFQNCAMMGVSAMCGSKRKLETMSGGSAPCKAARWEPEDCIARLQAVAVPGDSWRPLPTQQATPLQQTTPTEARLRPRPASVADLPDEDDDDEDEFDDESSDCEFEYLPTRYGGYWPPPTYYHQPPPPQNTIRREENGKSYLELGPPAVASPASPPCYRQRRLAVLNLSMCKLARYRQCSDPSLRRSVLICNTLRHIEREMEAEGSVHQQHHPAAPAVQPPTPAAPCYAPYEYELATPSGRATPFPSAPVATPIATTATPSTPASDDSGFSDDDRTINWGSVLSLTAQAGLAEPLNNNELYAELGLGSPEPQPSDWDSFMQVLVSGT